MPDVREGYQNIFQRKHSAVYLFTPPTRGNTGGIMVAGSIAPTLDEQQWFNTFRIEVAQLF